MSQQRDFVLDIHDKPKALNWLTMSLQHLFAMFWVDGVSAVPSRVQPGNCFDFKRGRNACFPAHYKRSNSFLSWFIVRVHHANHFRKSFVWTLKKRWLAVLSLTCLWNCCFDYKKEQELN